MRLPQVARRRLRALLQPRNVVVAVLVLLVAAAAVAVLAPSAVGVAIVLATGSLLLANAGAASWVVRKVRAAAPPVRRDPMNQARFDALAAEVIDTHRAVAALELRVALLAERLERGGEAHRGPAEDDERGRAPEHGTPPAQR